MCQASREGEFAGMRPCSGKAARSLARVGPGGTCRLGEPSERPVPASGGEVGEAGSACKVSQCRPAQKLGGPLST